MAGLVVATSLPTIFWREVLARPSPSWITVLGAGAAVLLLLATLVVNELRSLRLFGAVLLAQALGFAVIDLVGSSAAYRAWALAQPAALSFAAANSAKLVPVTLAAVVLAASGSTREQLFMRLGDMRALAELPLPITRRKTTWPRLGMAVIVLVAVYLVFHIGVTRHPEANVFGRLLTLAPVVLAGAAVNAFSEEFLFRNSLLSPLTATLGRPHAVWLTSIRFGIGHFYGNPSGPVGVAAATIFGFVLARSMLETRGSGWAWLIHFVQDVVIFGLIALTPPALWLP